jgi:hypothetical protein
VKGSLKMVELSVLTEDASQTFHEMAVAYIEMQRMQFRVRAEEVVLIVSINLGV